MKVYWLAWEKKGKRGEEGSEESRLRGEEGGERAMEKRRRMKMERDVYLCACINGV